MAFKGGLSFNLGRCASFHSLKRSSTRSGRRRSGGGSDEQLQHGIHHQQRALQPDYRYWTHVNSRFTDTLMKQISSDKQGFNSVFMMLDSGARGSK
jgi:DNA-directed RNA polymerase subunit beta'